VQHKQEPETLNLQITQETLAEMIASTRSRVHLFMNRFRKLDFTEYNGRMRVVVRREFARLTRHAGSRIRTGHVGSAFLFRIAQIKS
jgi:hypothetical protein